MTRSESASPNPDMMDRSPLYQARNASRYERQALIRQYEETYDCRLVVVHDTLFPHSITCFEEVLFDADPKEDLHVILETPGGDGETAVRLARQAQSRCNRLTAIIPDQAKSAGTLFVLGAHDIYMGPTSDLGPVDPQLRVADGSLVAAKAIIAAVDEAERRIQKSPATYPLHAALLADVTALLVQKARASLARTDDQLLEALACVPERSPDEVKVLAVKLREPLVNEPQIMPSISPLATHRISVCRSSQPILRVTVGEVYGASGRNTPYWILAVCMRVVRHPLLPRSSSTRLPSRLLQAGRCVPRFRARTGVSPHDGAVMVA